MKIDFKKSLLSFYLCSILYPNLSYAVDETIENNAKSYSNNTSFDNFTIKDTTDNGGNSNGTINENYTLTISNDLNISTTSTENAYLEGLAGSTINLNNVNLGQQTYIYGNNSDINISGLGTLENNGSIETTDSLININKTQLNATSYIAGYGDSRVQIQDANLSVNSKIYVEKQDINISGNLSLKDSSYLYADNNGTISVNNIHLEDNSTLGTNNGTISVNNNLTLDDNSSIYSSGNKAISLNGTSQLNTTSSVFSNGGININGTTSLHNNTNLDANNSILNINANITLDNNSSLYGMQTNGKILSTSSSTITLKDTSRIYTEYNDINLSGNLVAKNDSIIYADNGGDIILNNVTLEDNGTIIGKNNNITINGTAIFNDNGSIYSTGTGAISLNGVDTFTGEHSGIFIENNISKNISSNINITSSNKIILKEGSYVISQGDGNISLNKLDIIGNGFVIADNNISIKDINITDNGNLSYVLIKSNNGNLNITNLATPSNTTVITYDVVKTDSNLSVYKGFVDGSVFGITGNNIGVYNTLVWSMDKEKDSTLYNALNNTLSTKEIKKAVETMNPEISNSIISSINISNKSLSTVSSHIHTKNTKGISTGDELASLNLWIQAFTASSKQDDIDNTSGYISKGSGIVIGIEKIIEFDTTYGIALSFAGDSISSNNSLTNAKTDVASKQFIVYFSNNYKNSYLEGYFSLGLNDNRETRDIVLGSQTRQATASYNSQIKTMKLSYGRNSKFSSFTITPNGSISSSMISTDTYAESGADSLNLTVTNKDITKVTASIGVNISKSIKLQSGAIFDPEFRISYKKELDENYSNSTSKFRDADYTFTTDGLQVDDYALIYGTSLKYKTISRMSEYKIDLEVTKSEHFSSNSCSFTMQIKF